MNWKSKILASGVESLKKFGYPTVDKDNILTDYVYAKFFQKWLEDQYEEVIQRWPASKTAMDELVATCKAVEIAK